MASVAKKARSFYNANNHSLTALQQCCKNQQPKGTDERDTANVEKKREGQEMFQSTNFLPSSQTVSLILESEVE